RAGEASSFSPTGDMRPQGCPTAGNVCGPVASQSARGLNGPSTWSVEPAAMRPPLQRCAAFTPLLLLLAFLAGDQAISARSRMPADMPALVLWAWDRDDDLSFIDTRDTAVAYLAATVILRGEGVFLSPRHNPLAAP